jgi:predicted dithiol-disulfide oxidoreductase (DUF899 family)
MKTIEELENEIAAKTKKLNELRRRSASEVVKNYQFRDSRNATKTLAELFGSRPDLMIIHNMGSTCPYCTLWADSFNGMLDHFLSRTAFMVVSHDPPKVQQAFAKKRGWRFDMVSDETSEFTKDLGFFRKYDGQMGFWPGFSTFFKGADSKIVHVASASFGPGDTYCGIWPMLDLLESGLQDWEPKFAY